LSVHSLDPHRPVGIDLEFPAQPQDVRVDGARGGETLIPPDLVQQPLARDDLSAVLDEVHEQVELLAREAHVDARAEDTTSPQVDPYVPERELQRLLARPWAPE